MLVFVFLTSSGFLITQLIDYKIKNVFSGSLK